MTDPIFDHDKLDVYRVAMEYVAAIAILLAWVGPAVGWAARAGAPFAADANISDGPSTKIVRYAERLLARYDTDGGGTLSPAEWDSMSGRPVVMDRNQDGQITLAEMIVHIREYARYRRLGHAGLTDSVASSPERDKAADRLVMTAENDGQAGAGAAISERSGNERPDAPYYVPDKLLPSNLPGWFSQRDRNGDGQLSQAEFAPTQSLGAIQAFEQLDTNQDGLLAPREAAGSPPPTPSSSPSSPSTQP